MDLMKLHEQNELSNLNYRLLRAYCHAVASVINSLLQKLIPLTPTLSHRGERGKEELNSFNLTLSASICVFGGSNALFRKIRRKKSGPAILTDPPEAGDIPAGYFCTQRPPGAAVCTHQPGLAASRLVSA